MHFLCYMQLLVLKYLKQLMKIKSSNNYPCKAITFYFFLFFFLFLIAGLIFFIDIFFFIEIAIIVLAYGKVVQMTIITPYIVYKSSSAFASFQKRQEAGYKFPKITHVMIIPNYQEDEEIIKETLDNFAKQSRALNYCVFLAMEKHEMNAEEKAKKIISQYKNSFRLFSYTLHELTPEESKSKASNINWCVRKMVPQLLEKGVNLDQVMVTTMDADSLIHEAYFDQLQEHAERHYARLHTFVYQMPQFFTRNHNQAAFFVRVIDNLMSALHRNQLFSFCQFTLAVSNYSLTYRLLERIGFYDTDGYSKGEDLRINTKCFFKTNGEVTCCPIYIPANQISLETNQGYLADFKGRFNQAIKHCLDQIQISYVLGQFSVSSLHPLKKIYILFTFIQLYIIPSLASMVVIFMFLQDILQVLPRSDYNNGTIFNKLNNLGITLMMVICVVNEAYKRKYSKLLFNCSNNKNWYWIETPLLHTIIITIFGCFPILIASYRIFMEDAHFDLKVTEKKAQRRAKTQIDANIITQEEIEENKLFPSPRKEN